jgi:hypothetical protein
MDSRDSANKISECWLYLDCKVMTGHASSECPNRRNCMHNALESPNRACPLPYQRYLLFGDRSLEVCFLECESEAIAVGWHPAVRLPYEYYAIENILMVGKLLNELLHKS